MDRSSGAVFGTDGIRGVYGEGLTDGAAMLVGNSLGAAAEGGTIVIGRDTRTSGSNLARSLAEGAAAAGATVADLGVVTTPCVAYAARESGASAGVMISASHNPARYNGIKVFDGEGKKLSRERERLIDAATLREYLPAQEASLPAVTARAEGEPNFASEREILYKILFDMRKDVNDLKRLVYDIMRKEEPREEVAPPTSIVLRDMYAPRPAETAAAPTAHKGFAREKEESIQDTEAVEEESLSLEEKEREMIARALEKNHGKRKLAAQDLGISERTLYRKLKEYNLDK